MGTAAVGSFFILAMIGVGVLIAILWILMPFAIFGSKDLLRQLIREQHKTNELLQAQLDQGRAASQSTEVR